MPGTELSPSLMDAHHKPCLAVGGGSAEIRKAPALLPCGICLGWWSAFSYGNHTCGRTTIKKNKKKQA